MPHSAEILPSGTVALIKGQPLLPLVTVDGHFNGQYSARHPVTGNIGRYPEALLVRVPDGYVQAPALKGLPDIEAAEVKLGYLRLNVGWLSVAHGSGTIARCIGYCERELQIARYVEDGLRYFVGNTMERALRHIQLSAEALRRPEIREAA